MGFWIFMLVMDLLIPIIMIAFGNAFKKSSPKEINSVFGYRTERTMKSKAALKRNFDDFGSPRGQHM